MGGAIQQPNAETGFELSNRLTQGRSRQTQMIGSPSEAAALDDGHEGLQFCKI